MDQDGSLNISFNEWRDFLLLAPSDNIQEIIKYWRHSTVSTNYSLIATKRRRLSRGNQKRNHDETRKRLDRPVCLFIFSRRFRSHPVKWRLFENAIIVTSRR